MQTRGAWLNAQATVRWDRRRRWCRVIGLAVIVGLAVRPVVAATCVGDCKGAGKVDIADLIIGVNIALGLQPVADCEAFANAGGRVDVAQLIQGVNNALNGCPRPPTPSVTVPATDTPTQTVTPTSTPADTPSMTPTQPGQHFVDNGDGTITDTQTGLSWEKKDQGVRVAGRRAPALGAPAV